LAGFATVAATPAGVATAGPSTSEPEGGIGLRLVDAPVSGRDDPRARVYIVDHLAPGAVIRRRIELTNTAATVARVVLYAGAASIARGTFLGAPPGAPNELSTWTSVRPGTADIPAGGRVTITATIAVPRDAAPGEQYGVVWAEARSPTVATGLTQVSRVGIRLYLSIGPGGAPAPDFTVDSVVATRSAEGQPTIIATVHNTGGRALDISGTLRLLAGPGGLSAGPFPATLGVTLAIGASESVTIVLDRQVPAGPWDARIALRSGLLERGAHATITFPDVGAAPVVYAVPRPSGPPYAVIVGALVLLLCVAGLIVALIRRRRRSTASRARSIATRPPEEQRIVATALEPAQPARPDRRRRATTAPSRLAEQPVTVAAILDTPHHGPPALAHAHDPLSNLATRSLFEEEIQFALSARGGLRLYLMVIGLDDLATTTATYGRPASQAMLLTTAERLRRAVRPQDLIAWLEGDTFAVLFDDIERSDVEAVTRRMLRTVHEPQSIGGHQVSVRATLGLAEATATDNAALLIRHATAALAEVRATGATRDGWYSAAAPSRLP
jgi:diguanylate cyclase (GGDEF)-like protein